MALVVTLTVNPALDLTVPVDRVISGRKLRCGAPRLDPGGGGINVARVLHRLGVPTIALYAVGGLTGERLRELIDREGFAHRPIAVAGETRQSFTAVEAASGEPYRFILPGPELSANEWQSLQDATIEMAERADLVVASGSLAPGMPEDFYARLAEAMRASGDRLVLDSSGPGLGTTLERTPVYLVKPNMHEIAELAGQELVWPEGQADWASALIARGRSEIVRGHPWRRGCPPGDPRPAHADQAAGDHGGERGRRRRQLYWRSVCRPGGGPEHRRGRRSGHGRSGGNAAHPWHAAVRSGRGGALAGARSRCSKSSSCRRPPRAPPSPAGSR